MTSSKIETAPVRRVLEIENALRWAASELARPYAARLRGPAGYSSTSFRLERVDNGSARHDPDADMPDLHPDALALKRAVDTLDVGALDLSAYRLGEGAGRVDVETLAWDARRNVRAAIWLHARNSNRPDLGAPPEFGKVIAANGRPAIVNEANGPACSLEWVRSLEDVIEDRAAYAAWHAALTRIAETVQLSTIVVSGPSATSCPWLEMSAPVRILASKPLKRLKNSKICSKQSLFA